MFSSLSLASALAADCARAEPDDTAKLSIPNRQNFTNAFIRRFPLLRGCIKPYSQAVLGMLEVPQIRWRLIPLVGIKSRSIPRKQSSLPTPASLLAVLGGDFAGNVLLLLSQSPNTTRKGQTRRLLRAQRRRFQSSNSPLKL